MKKDEKWHIVFVNGSNIQYRSHLYPASSTITSNTEDGIEKPGMGIDASGIAHVAAFDGPRAIIYVKSEASVGINDESQFMIKKINNCVMIVSPNPFRNYTKIGFGMPSDSDIRIYKSGGRLIKRLQNGNRTGSDYSAVWDGTDNCGAPVPNGTYICELSTTDVVVTHRVVRMK